MKRFLGAVLGLSAVLWPGNRAESRSPQDPALPPEPTFLASDQTLRGQLRVFLSRSYISGPPPLGRELMARREEAGPVLMEILKDRSFLERGRAEAANLLSALDTDGTGAALLAILDENPIPEDLLRTAITCLGHRRDPGAVEALVQAFETAPWFDRQRSIVDALGFLGDPKGLPVMDRVLQERRYDPSLKVHAERGRKAIQLRSSDDWMGECYRRLSPQDPLCGYALRFLRKGKVPDLAARLRGLEDREREKPKEQRNAGYEYALLSTIRSCGGTLTNCEILFLRQGEARTCTPFDLKLPE